jgi:hypothetical protein
MTRTFQDKNFLVWEAYSSGGRHGFSKDPHIIFHCLTQRDVRPRYIETGSDDAEAQRILGEASEPDLLALLEGAREIA